MKVRSDSSYEKVSPINFLNKLGKSGRRIKEMGLVLGLKASVEQSRVIGKRILDLKIRSVKNNSVMFFVSSCDVRPRVPSRSKKHDGRRGGALPSFRLVFLA